MEVVERECEKWYEILFTDVAPSRGFLTPRLIFSLIMTRHHRSFFPGREKWSV